MDEILWIYSIRNKVVVNHDDKPHVVIEKFVRSLKFFGIKAKIKYDKNSKEIVTLTNRLNRI